MAGPLVAGVDCSTQGTKVLVVDPDDGAVVASGRASHHVTGTHGARETDPAQWWHALAQALAQTGRTAEIGALSIGGQQHGLVVIGDGGQPLRPAMLWNDTRAAEDATRLRGRLGGADGWASEVGVVPVASFTVSKWAWLKRVEPIIAAATRAVRLPHDHLTALLTGESVTDRGDASGTGWWSTRTQDYSDEVLSLEEVQLPTTLLPRVLGADQAAGTVQREVASQLGLPTDVIVGPGTGDNMAAALGLAMPRGAAAMSLGTSGTVYAVSDQRVVDPTGVVAGFADATGAYLPLACTLNATQAVDRFAAWLGIERDAVEEGGSVVVSPFLDGERTPDLPHAAGTITGLRHDTTPGQILRAAYEGIVVSLIDALDQVAEHSGPLDPEQPLYLIGGGARGAVYRRIVMRLSGRALVIPSADELVALGAAAQAAAVREGISARDMASRWAEKSDRTRIEAEEIDMAALTRHREVRAHLAALDADPHP